MRRAFNGDSFLFDLKILDIVFDKPNVIWRNKGFRMEIYLSYVKNVLR